jgi:tetratricopeptide (TPR) repeat protein
MAALRRDVAVAEAHRMTGKFDEALAAANAALVEARAIPHPQSEAELLLLVAACRREVEGDAIAREAFEDAFAACEAAGDDSLAAIAAAAVAVELADTLADFPEGERWLSIAKGTRAREASDDRADAEILEAELALLSAEGHADRSPELRDREIALLERIYGASHPRIAVAYANLAGDLDATGQFGAAVDEYRKAIAMQEQLFGPDVPMLSIYYNNFGSTLTDAGRYDEAKPAIEHALALVAPLGPTNPHNVLPLVSLAQLDRRTRDYDATLSAADRGIAIVDGGGDAEVRFLPALLVVRGTALLAKGDAAAAEASCARALALQEKQDVLGPDRIQLEAEDALTCIGEARMAEGHPADALAPLERSVSLTRRMDPGELALAKLALARALVASGGDGDRARALAEEARATLRAAPGRERDAADADAWLAQRNGSAR